jgi:hypothetical protein
MARIIDKSYTRICRTTKPQIAKKTRARKSQKGDGIFDLDYELPREAQRIVSAKGTSPISAFTVMKTPLNAAVGGLANLITFGGVSQIKKDLKTDSMFHLFSVITLQDGSRYLFEKNDRINLTPDVPQFDPSTTQSMAINITIPQTLSSMLDAMKAKMGPEAFYTYDAFTNNCQDFLLTAVSTLTTPDEAITNFVKQDIAKSVAKINPWSRKLAHGVTNLGNWVNGWKDRFLGLFGKGRKKHKNLTR